MSRRLYRPTPLRPGAAGAKESGRVALVARQVDAELLELAIEVRSLEPRLLGNARHAAVLLREVELEIAFFEGVARLAQRPVEVEALLRLRAEQGRRQLLDGAARHRRLDGEAAAVLAGGGIERRGQPRRRLGQALLDGAQQLLQGDRLLEEGHRAELG